MRIRHNSWAEYEIDLPLLEGESRPRVLRLNNVTYEEAQSIELGLRLLRMKRSREQQAALRGEQAACVLCHGIGRVPTSDGGDPCPGCAYRSPSP